MRPLSEIFVELNKTIPLNRYFSRINVSDKAVGGEEDFPTDNDFDGMEIKILGLKMHYLSYQLTSNVFIHKMIKDTYYYIYELPECRTSLLMADTTSESIRFSVVRIYETIKTLTFLLIVLPFI